MKALEFKEINFHYGMKFYIISKNEIKDLIAIDFELLLFGYDDLSQIQPTWIPIDDCEIIED